MYLQRLEKLQKVQITSSHSELETQVLLWELGLLWLGTVPETSACAPQLEGMKRGYLWVKDIGNNVINPLPASQNYL